jgi:hypothetical protein
MRSCSSSVHVLDKGRPPALSDPVAVSSSTRVAAAREIPPMAEAITDFESIALIMFMASARTRPQIVDRLRAELV